MERNKDLLRRYIDALNKRDFAALRNFIAEDYVYHGFGVELHGADGNEQLLRPFLEGFPDLHVTIEDLVAEGDRCACRLIIRGTHTGVFMGVPATGKQIEMASSCISRLENGKLVEDWEEGDMLGLLQQIGAAPATAAAATK
jgi:steroid delta-isomerase-like uncharacterized protein